MSPEKKKYELNHIFTSELRFFIMTVLAMYEEVDFNFLKKELSASDGNLSVNLTKLETAGFLSSRKEFISKKPRSFYKITDKGLQELNAHIDTINQFKNKIRKTK